MERIEEIKNLIVQLEIKLKELKNEIFPDEILVTIEEFKEVELVTSTYQIDYLKFRNFRFESRKDSISNQNINKDIVLDIKNGTLKSFVLKSGVNRSINNIILNSEIVDATRKL